MVKTVVFFGTAPSRGEVVLSSKPIGYPFRLKRIMARFPPGCANLVRQRYLIADDGSVGTGALVSGVSVLQDAGQVDYLVGDDCSKTLDHEVEHPTAGGFLKVQAVNDDFADHGVDVQMTIEVTGQE